MYINGIEQEIDPGRGTTPVIIPKWGRTIVPIRALVEALGGTIVWDGDTRKVTINFKGTLIELWIDNPKAKVNGVENWIDTSNHDVKPTIINSRTMLPLRFVAENLGCQVDWEGTTQTITITYQAP
ncbi:MAG: copper amine oxidase [Caldiserica bacterium CG_4_8_14_3_um_filter_35_18]|nr:copper amine oxidase N-terminal domain-containing protein [Caldisericota bacterium]PIX29274.1 MAG: copper amine oxidase [Caldiserica bacterium CG_4_8_14_3_um_filter_35_18]